jgi:molybdenum cofactor cytidylyltransferase
MDGRPRNVGVLLAAGAGRRYGKPKVLVDGWLDNAVAALRDGGCAYVVLVLGAAQVAPPPGVTAITARHWHEGLSASVRAGLVRADQMHADYAVLHVIDTPDVGAAVVSRVLDRALSSESGLARAYFGDQPGHPVVIGRRHWPEVLALISGDRGAGAYLSTRRDVEIVDCADLAGGQDVDELVGPPQRALSARPLAPERDVNLRAKPCHPDSAAPDHRLDAPRSRDETDKF